MATHSTQPERRTQAERRSQTRAKLLEATIESLLTVGYQGTTTRHVAELAGLTTGAQTYHFPTRTELVAAAVEHVTEQRLEELHRHAADLPEDRADRLRAVLDLLWQDFSSPLFITVVKLWVAAADDPELQARMIPTERLMRRAVRDVSGALLGDLADDADLQDRMSLVLSTVRGLGFTQAFEPGGPRRDLWPAHRRLLEALLQL